MIHILLLNHLGENQLTFDWYTDGFFNACTFYCFFNGYLIIFEVFYSLIIVWFELYIVAKRFYLLSIIFDLLYLPKGVLAGTTNCYN